MAGIVSRIKQYIDFKEISVRKFEESVGFSNGAFASQYKNNRTIGVDKLENILQKYPDINLDWLILGKGEMIKEQSASNLHSADGAQLDRLLTIIESQQRQMESQQRIIENLSKKTDARLGELANSAAAV